MELSEGQMLLLEYLKSIEVEEEFMIGIMLTVKEPEQIDRLIDWIVENYHKQIKLNQGQILHKACQIATQKES